MCFAISASDRVRAKGAGIVAVENDPSLESTLLRVAGISVARTTAQNKRLFEDRFGGPAAREHVIRRNFDRAMFDSARSDVEPIDVFLRLIRRV